MHAWYGESHILHGIDLTVNRGEVVTLLGRNGAGRTTTLKAILGLVGRRSGSIMVNGTEAVHLPPHRIAHLGLGYCPEERGIFASLSCEENLLLPPPVADGGMSLDEIYAMFPNLRERRASPGGRLSGGEQQMLSVARILRTGAKLLLLDEISEGLAPVIVQALGRAIRTMREQGHDHRDGRAELPLRRTAGGPVLRHRARARHRALRGVRAGRAARDAARSARDLRGRHAGMGHQYFHVTLLKETDMKRKLLSTLAGAVLAAMGTGAAQAQISDGVIKIGVMNDMSGLYADITGPGSLLAAKMAVEDFGAAGKGMKVEVLSADHQNKPDVGSNIARTWYDVDKVDAIFDVPTSSVAWR